MNMIPENVLVCTILYFDIIIPNMNWRGGLVNALK